MCFEGFSKPYRMTLLRAPFPPFLERKRAMVSLQTIFYVALVCLVYAIDMSRGGERVSHTSRNRFQLRSRPASRQSLRSPFAPAPP